MIEDAYAPPTHPPEAPAPRGARRSDSRAFLLLTTGVLFTLFPVQWSIGNLTFDLFSDGVGYGMFALGAWQLRAASKWFTYAVPVALVFALADFVRTFADDWTGDWFSTVLMTTRVGALSLALFGSTVFAEAIGSTPIAVRARIANGLTWLAMIVAIALQVLRMKMSVQAGVPIYVLNLAGACLSLIVFTQLSARAEHAAATLRRRRSPT